MTTKTAKSRNHDHARSQRAKRAQRNRARAEYTSAINKAQRGGPQAAEAVAKEYYPLLEKLREEEKAIRKKR